MSHATNTSVSRRFFLWISMFAALLLACAVALLIMPAEHAEANIASGSNATEPGSSGIGRPGISVRTNFANEAGKHLSRDDHVNVAADEFNVFLPDGSAGVELWVEGPCLTTATVSWGDGSPVDTVVISAPLPQTFPTAHQYKQSGTFRVTAVFAAGIPTEPGVVCESNTRTGTFEVPPLNVTGQPQSACVNKPTTFTFTAQGAGSHLVSWSGGQDPATGSGKTFRTQFTTAGTHTVRASVDGGQSASTSVEVLPATDPQCTLTVTAEPQSACRYQPITFTARGPGASRARWSGGEDPAGGTGTTFTTKFFGFTAPGTHSVTAAVPGGQSASAEVEVLPDSHQQCELPPKIPQIMRSHGWLTGALFQERWLSSPARVAPNYAPPDTTTVKMGSWVLTFPKAREAYDDIMARQLWANADAEKKIRAVLARKGLLRTRKVCFDDLNAPIQELDRDHVHVTKVRLRVRDLLDMNDLDAALGDFSFKAVVAGCVEPVWSNQGTHQVTITRVGVYVQDSFDFDGPQFLGFWDPYDNSVSGINPSSGMAVYNGTYREWREEHGRGGDFKIFSDVLTTTLTSPVKLTF